MTSPPTAPGDGSVLPDGRASIHELLDVEILEAGPERVVMRLPVDWKVHQPYGILHGGVYSSLVESLCSYATAVAVYEDGMIAMGQSIEVSFVRPVTAGHAEARAVARHRGRSTWVWQVEVLDDDERLCAVAKMTMAVRPAPQS